MIDFDIEKKNAEWIGKDGMHQQLIEECGELIKALCKYNRANGIGQPTPITKEEARDNLVSEIADVAICIEQFCYLVGITADEVEVKRTLAVSKVAQRRLENE